MEIYFSGAAPGFVRERSQRGADEELFVGTNASSSHANFELFHPLNIFGADASKFSGVRIGGPGVRYHVVN